MRPPAAQYDLACRGLETRSLAFYFGNEEHFTAVRQTVNPVPPRYRTLNEQPRIIAYEKFVINHFTLQLISSCNNSPGPSRRAHRVYRQLGVGPQAVRVYNRK